MIALDRSLRAPYPNAGIAMIAVLDLEYIDRIDRSRWLSVGHLAGDGRGRKRVAGVVDSAHGDAVSA
jgi:hypothetical protein